MYLEDVARVRRTLGGTRGEELDLPGRKREYDEDDVRIRPGRSSRPRTRTRPRHDDAVDALVITVDRGRYGCVLEEPAADDSRAGKDAPRAGKGQAARSGGAAPRSADGASDADGDFVVITAMRARELGRKSVVVGDRVALVGDVSGAPGALARIVRIAERTSVLRRTADDDDTTPEGRLERVVVANADQLVIVSALADPPPRTGFIDRCLVAAYDADVDPLLCLTKADLAGPEEVLDYYAELDLPHVLIRPGSDLDELRERLAGRISVLVGHSGVGKSTLVNRLVPDALRAVGAVSAVGKGRHTSTSAVALRLPPVGPAKKGSAKKDPGWIVDTPGIRSFGLAHVSADSLLHGFPDLVEGTLDDQPNCGHTAADADCHLDAWVAAGKADARRLASYRRLLASRAGELDQRGGEADQWPSELDQRPPEPDRADEDPDETDDEADEDADEDDDAADEDTDLADNTADEDADEIDDAADETDENTNAAHAVAEDNDVADEDPADEDAGEDRTGEESGVGEGSSIG